MTTSAQVIRLKFKMSEVTGDGCDENSDAIENLHLDSVSENNNLQRQTVDGTVADVPSSKAGTVADDEKSRRERKGTMKNIVLISVAFLFCFTSYGGLNRLQSSLHHVEGMGVITSSVLNASFTISCMFVPTALINFLGHKWSMVVSFPGYLLWMAANGYAVWGTMITGSILIGVSAAPLWIAQSAYFIIIGRRYAELTGETEEAVVSRFFGIFYSIFQLCESTYMHIEFL